MFQPAPWSPPVRRRWLPSKTAAFGTITTPPLKNNTGTVLANETGLTVNVLHPTTSVLVVQKTGQTTDASGIATISDALIVTGTSYAYEPVTTSNGRRLPVATAT